MFKAKAKAGDGRTLVILGLSDENIARLQQGQPIYFDTDQLKIPAGETVGHICLLYGKDEATIAHELSSLIGPQTDGFHVPDAPKRPQ
jgi:hypothetical protein